MSPSHEGEYDFEVLLEDLQEEVARRRVLFAAIGFGAIIVGVFVYAKINMNAS
jgi:hypothetical protein